MERVAFTRASRVMYSFWGLFKNNAHCSDFPKVTSWVSQPNFLVTRFSQKNLRNLETDSSRNMFGMKSEDPGWRSSKRFYIISCVINAFWLFLTYDLLEDRRRMADSFVSYEDVLPDWANEDVEKSLAEAVDKFHNQKEKKNTFLCRKWLKQNTRTVSVERHLTKRKIFLYYIKQMDSMLLCDCSVDHRRTSKWGTRGDLFLPHFDVIKDLLGSFSSDDGDGNENVKVLLLDLLCLLRLSQFL